MNSGQAQGLDSIAGAFLEGKRSLARTWKTGNLVLKAGDHEAFQPIIYDPAGRSRRPVLRFLDCLQQGLVQIQAPTRRPNRRGIGHGEGPGYTAAPRLGQDR